MMIYKPLTNNSTPLIIEDIKEYLKEDLRGQVTIDTGDLAHLIGEIERLKEEIDKCDIQRRVIKDLNKSLTEVHKEKERLKKVLKYLELYFSNKEDYELSQLIRDTKEANIEWLDKAIDRFKGIDLTEKDKRQIRGLKEEFKIGDKE